MDSGSIAARLSAFRQNGDDQRWLASAAILLACIATLTAVFWREVSGALTVWNESPTFNHCFLILPISLFMMWTRREGLASLPQHARPWLAALFILPLSFAWLVTSIASILEAQQLVVVMILQAMLLSIFGWPVYRRFMAPFLYLYFLVPSGAELVPALQQLTAYLAVGGLKLIGIPVYSNGAVIDIPAGTFAVAEACAGLRFLVATIAFGVFYAAQIYRSIPRRLAFIALCVIVPIIANGMRVFGIIAAAQWLGNPTAAVADHLIYGWGFFSLVLIVLVIVGRRFADPAVSGQPDTTTEREIGPAQLWPMAATGALCIALAAAFPVLSLFLNGSAGASLPQTTPSLSSGWQPVSDDSDWKPVIVAPGRTMSAAYSDGHQTVYSFIALYPPRGGNLMRSNNRIAEESVWKLNSSAKEAIAVDGQRVSVDVTTIVSGTRRLKVWSFYVIGGKVKTGILQVKLSQIETYLARESCATAFVAIAAPLDDGRAVNGAVISRYLSATTSLRQYLCNR